MSISFRCYHKKHCERDNIELIWITYYLLDFVILYNDKTF